MFTHQSIIFAFLLSNSSTKIWSRWKRRHLLHTGVLSHDYLLTISFHQRVSMIFSYLLKQSITLSFLTLQPTPSIPFLQQYSLSPPYLDAYSSICFPVVMARIREKMLFILFFVFFLNGATRGKAQLSTLPQKGGRFLLSKNASSAIRAQQAAELCSKASFVSFQQKQYMVRSALFHPARIP